MKIIAIDFDGTIVEDAYPAIGRLKPGAKKALNQLYNHDEIYTIINTCRSGEQLIDAVNFLIENGIKFNRINDNYPDNIKKYGNTRKVFADVYIDASNLTGMPAWDLVYDLIINEL